MPACTRTRAVWRSTWIHLILRMPRQAKSRTTVPIGETVLPDPPDHGLVHLHNDSCAQLQCGQRSTVSAVNKRHAESQPRIVVRGVGDRFRLKAAVLERLTFVESGLGHDSFETALES